MGSVDESDILIVDEIPEDHLNEMFNDNYAKQQRELEKRLRKKGQENYIKDLYDEM